MYSLNIRTRSYENIGLVFIAILTAIGGIYSYKFISFLMPLLTLLVIWAQGGLKNISLSLPLPLFFFFLLLGLSGLSLFWTINPTPALKTFVSLNMTFIFGILLITCLMKATPNLVSHAYTLLKISGIVLSALILMQVWGGIKPYAGASLMIKPTGSILGLLSFVGCAFLWIKGNKLLSILTFLFLTLLISLTHCQTAFYGIMGATFVFVLSYTMPFWTTRMAMVTSYLYLLLSPLLCVYMFPPSVVSQSSALAGILNFSFFHRFISWEFYSKKFFEKPFLGWGLESARSLPIIDPNFPPGYEVIHPHNNAVQLYAELGLLGGILFAFFFASLFWSVQKNVKDRLSIAVCNATIVFGFVTAEITHNVWRNYWLSLVILTAGLVILFLKAREGQLHAEACH